MSPRAAAGDIEECACVGCDGSAPCASADVRGFCTRCESCGCSFRDGPRCGESWDRDPTDDVEPATTTPDDDARAIARTVLQPIEDQKVAAPDAYRAIMRAIVDEADRREPVETDLHAFAEGLLAGADAPPDADAIDAVLAQVEELPVERQIAVLEFARASLVVRPSRGKRSAAFVLDGSVPIAFGTARHPEAPIATLAISRSDVEHAATLVVGETLRRPTWSIRRQR